MKVVVNGVFDLLHPGHLDLLRAARSEPNSVVTVLIDSDRRVKDLKGPERPIIAEIDRAYMLENLRCVDEVRIFHSEEELENLIKELSPDIMYKGSHYIGKRIVGEKYCKKIKFVNINEQYSTTKLIQHITNR